MKHIIAHSLIVFCLVFAFSITGKSQPPTPTATPLSFGDQGMWNAQNADKVTIISYGLSKPRKFLINRFGSPGVPAGAEFRIVVDGVELADPLVSPTLVEGRNIFIRQSIYVAPPPPQPPTNRVLASVEQGDWKLIQEPRSGFEFYSFLAGFTATSTAAGSFPLVNFIEPQEIRLDLDRWDSNTPCQTGFVALTVDGKQLTNPLSNKVAVFPMGSSVILYARQISASFTGSCNNPAPGYLKTSFRFRTTQIP